MKDWTMTDEDKVNTSAEEKSKCKNARKNVRHRKKHLHVAIQQQMEFYFGDSNLAKDKFLSKCILENEDGYVSLDVFMTFNKIKAMTTDMKTLKKSLKHSTMLQLSEDGNFVRRTTEVVRRSDVDDCTIYVERFPPDVDREWLQQVFTQFGAITYISLPKFPNQALKGFAFVEFEKPESAQKAFRYYHTSGHLQSHDEVHTSAPKDGETVSNDNDGKSLKRKLDVTESEKDENAKSSCEESQQRKRSKYPDTSTEKSEQELKSADSKDKCDKKKKSRKKRKKILAIKEVPYIFPLRVMLKNDWKIAKKQYLAIQKANMAKLKASLLNHDPETASFPEIFGAAEEKKTPKKKYEFVPGSIVSFNIPNDCKDANSYKELKSNVGVQYVDVDDFTSQVFVRCADSSSASQLAKSLDGQAQILSGKAEENYWKKLWSDHEARLTSKHKMKKRGVQKVLAKAERVIQQKSKHIRFDE